MSGKSTLPRTIALNAILAQSIHTTFGSWRASPLHVRTVMRIAGMPERSMSTYAVEVAAMRELVTDDRPCLFAIDEPFNGTSPGVAITDRAANEVPPTRGCPGSWPVLSLDRCAIATR